MMKFKDFRLDVEALFSQIVYGHGFLHYGYWKSGKPETVSLESLGKAQKDYFEKIVEMLPPDVTSILDVGSGTGSNASELIKRGYVVDCVCPSSQLNAIAEKKLPSESQIYHCRFEDLLSPKTYDLLFFSESFHYTNAMESFKQAINYTNKYLLVFDYFRKNDSHNGQRISYDQFQQLLNGPYRSVFDILHDEDVTQYVSPTFFVIDEISNTYIKPFIDNAVSRYRKDHPIYSLMFYTFIKQIQKYAQKTSNRYSTFSKENEYRLILLEKKQNTDS